MFSAATANFCNKCLSCHICFTSLVNIRAPFDKKCFQSQAFEFVVVLKWANDFDSIIAPSCHFHYPQCQPPNLRNILITIIFLIVYGLTNGGCKQAHLRVNCSSNTTSSAEKCSYKSVRLHHYLNYSLHYDPLPAELPSYLWSSSSLAYTCAWCNWECLICNIFLPEVMIGKQFL